MWNRFWNSTFNNNGSIIETESHASLDDESRSISSGHYNHPSSPQPPHYPSLSRPSHRDHRHSVFSNNSTAFNPNQYATQPQSQQLHHFQQPSAPSTILSGTGGGGGGGSTLLDPSQFGFKLRDKRSGKVHRFTSSSSQIAEVLAAVRTKLGGVAPGTVSYEDDDGDAVLLGSNADLEEAVGMARRHGWERLVLQVREEAPLASQVVASPVKQNAMMAEEKSSKKEVARRRGSAANVEGSSVADFLKDAPLAVNVAISAGIVVVAAFVISRMQRI
ncbi:hypothetical protein BC830DRAFT_1106457 [Chytriomyces sp. MP71]|nr:hypothetical protein BC830DRAFT_1106457 [Chytriomyces sp. MP71]